MNQGDVFWHTFAAPDKRRPVVVITRQPALRFLTSVTVAPVTSRVRQTASHVPVGPADGVPRPSAVNLDGVQTVAVADLGPYITSLSRARLAQVRAAIEFAFGLAALDPDRV